MDDKMTVKEEMDMMIEKVASDRKIEISNDLDLVEDLGIGSLEMMRLVVEVEEKFDVCIPDEKMDLDELKSYSNMVEIVSDIIEKKKEGEFNDEITNQYE